MLADPCCVASVLEVPIFAFGGIEKWIVKCFGLHRARRGKYYGSAGRDRFVSLVKT